jgi:hypothetical protein
MSLKDVGEDLAHADRLYVYKLAYTELLGSPPPSMADSHDIDENQARMLRFDIEDIGSRRNGTNIVHLRTITTTDTRHRLEEVPGDKPPITKKALQASHSFSRSLADRFLSALDVELVRGVGRRHGLGVVARRQILASICQQSCQVTPRS